jgi:hypothetical protein
LVFTPFPTGTSGNGDIFEVNWTGSYDFEQFSSNFKDNGFKGQLRLRETPK